ncbi:MAG: ribonuclease P protein component [Bacteroidia bacterium]|nr:ribonuclease P protein component [Bacteroidia bacterium]MDW8134884.1 ribonuclease P protein component [Bacteroidia bacterium]
MSFAFPRAERLRGKKKFKILRTWAKTYKLSCLSLKAIHFPLHINGPLIQVAFSVTKKTQRKSVRRNRTKRLLREAYRLQKPLFTTLWQEGQAWLLWQWNCEYPPILSSLKSEMRKLFLYFIQDAQASD